MVSALIANVRQYWQGYPATALAPGLAFFFSILAFNLFGDSLRHWLEDSALGLSRLLNRRTAVFAVGVTVALALLLRSSAPLSIYHSDAMKFDAQRVMEDIRILSSPELQGRETGLPGADLAALYIVYRMADIGIFPAGENHSYFQRLVQPRLHLRDLPTLTLLDGAGGNSRQFLYRQEFSEIARYAQSRGQAQGAIMGVAYGPVRDVASGTSQFDLSNSAAVDHVILVRAADLAKVASRLTKGILAIADGVGELTRRDVYPSELARSEDPRPYLLVSPEVGDMLLRTAGSSLAELDATRSSLAPGAIKLTAPGATVSLRVPAGESENPGDEAYVNVIGVIPGQGHFMGTEEQIVVVSAYYDGVGVDPQGTIYPGANDNASGVAVMLELARLLKESPYQPDKTVLFVAWAGGERQEVLSLANILNARPGASDFTVESVLELSGVGYGAGTAISIGSDSSYRLAKLFQQAAGSLGAATTTRGRGPHQDLPAQAAVTSRDAMTLSLSWDGADQLAHTPEDTFAIIDPEKIRTTGQPAYLTLLILCRETEF